MQTIPHSKIVLKLHQFLSELIFIIILFYPCLTNKSTFLLIRIKTPTELAQCHILLFYLVILDCYINTFF